MGTGFHELASLVAPVDFGDTLELELEEGGPEVMVECSDPSVPSGESNLAGRAVRLFLDRYGFKKRARIRLTKRIPHGAGLGGGSSNAAAALEGMAQLCGRTDDQETLQELAAELGSDCPLFLKRAPLVMRGRGERLEALSGCERDRLRGARILLFKPSFSIPTAWAYRTLAEDSGNYDNTSWAEDRLARWKEGAVSLSDLLHNSFEPVAFRKYPALERLAQRFRSAELPMLMSGSGSACFALVEDEQREETLRKIVRECWGKSAFVEPANLL